MWYFVSDVKSNICLAFILMSYCSAERERMKPYLITGWMCIQTTDCLHFNDFSILRKKHREVLQGSGTVILFPK